MNLITKHLVGIASVIILILSFPLFAETKILMETSEGNIVLSLDETKAPVTVANFVTYTQEGFYNGTIFHRVISGFMIQGGGFDKDMKQKAAKKEIINEGSNGLLNNRGTIAMARKGDPNSATAQFFINHANNNFLNANGNKPGYTVFGQVVEGMDIVDKIAKANTTTKNGYQNVPIQAITIQKMSVIENQQAEKKLTLTK